ncbi:MAG: ABC transporter ATP-binding protein [Bacteroidota bacterium]
MLRVKDISFAYGARLVLENISLELSEGSHLALLGESGSGKSTLLKAIYGLLKLSQGTIFWKDQQLLGPEYHLIPGEHFIKYVSQEPDLMPFTTVAENIREHLSVYEQQYHSQRVEELLKVFQMTDYAETKVKDLSGGQQQRVSMARALAQEPELLLLDEPFSGVDQFQKNTLRQLLFPYLREKNIAVISATHDPEDVLPFAGSCIVLKKGKIIDQGPTKAIYHYPKSRYVATLFGEANEIPLFYLHSDYYRDRNVIVYPHELMVHPNAPLEVVVSQSFFKGSHYLIMSKHETDLPIFFTHSKGIIPGTKVQLKIASNTLIDRITRRNRS